MSCTIKRKNIQDYSDWLIVCKVSGKDDINKMPIYRLYYPTCFLINYNVHNVGKSDIFL